MIIRNVQYKGVSFADSLYENNQFVLIEANKGVQLRTATYDKQNFHGTDTSFTLASWRLFSFKGVIFGETREKRWTGQNILNNIIVPETSPSETSKGFFSLKWIDDNGTEMECMAKVYSMPEYGHDNGSTLIEFSFELYCEESYYSNTVENNSSGSYGVFWGVSLPFSLPNAFDSAIGDFSVFNDGNFWAPCKIQVIGSIQNPKITNLSQKAFYGTLKTTTNLFIDSGTNPMSVTDELVDVSGYRIEGSTALFVLQGENRFLLTGDNYVSGSPVSIQVSWKDTYISS